MKDYQHPTLIDAVLMYTANAPARLEAEAWAINSWRDYQKAIKV